MRRFGADFLIGWGDASAQIEPCLAAEFIERAGFEAFPHLFHKTHEAVDIVDREEANAEDFAGMEEMPHVGAGKIPATIAGATLFHGAKIIGVATGLDGNGAVAGKGGAVAGMARRHDAVEHIDSAGNAFDDLNPVADAHQVTGMGSGDVGDGEIDSAHHFGFRFTDADATDGITIEADFRKPLCAAFAQIGIDAALNDSKEQLTGAERLSAATFGPSECFVDGFRGVVVRCGIRDAFIETHHDIRAEDLLRPDGFRGAQEELFPIDMGLEGDAIGFDFAEFAERKDLKAAGIGQDGAIPSHKRVQTSAVLHDFVAGAQEQVIGIAENDPDLQLFQIARLERLDGSLRTDRHENGGLDGSVGGLQDAPPSVEARQDGLFARNRECR